MRRSILAFLLLACTVLSAQAQQTSFGRSTAVGDHEMFVGQPTNPNGPGVVFVFQHNEEANTWDRTELSASNNTPGDGFGRSLDVEGSMLVVGAPGHEGGSGALYIFERNDMGEWTETTQLTATTADTSAGVGTAVAISGSFIVTGAPTANEAAGAIFVFHKDGDTWKETQTLTGSDTEANDLFGSAVAIDEHMIYVGAPGNGNGLGSVYAFQHTDNMYVQETKLVDTGDAHKALGASLIIAGDGHILSGAPGITLDGGQPQEAPPSGGVLQFTRNGDTWTQGTSILPDSSYSFNLFGFDLAMSNDMYLVTSPGAQSFAGALYVYDKETGASREVPADGGGQQIFGLSVATAGNMAIVSAPGANSGDGAVHVVSLDGEPEKVGTLTPYEIQELELVANGPAECSEGLAWQFDCSEVDLLSFLPIEDLGGTEDINLNDIWGWTDPETDREYALVGRTNGTAFVDVTDPSMPVFLGDLSLTKGAQSSSWRDIKVYADHAFIVADGAGAHGMQIFDLRQLRDVTDAPMAFVETARYDSIASSHNIVINEETGFAYAVGSGSGGITCGGGLHMINIQDPLAPSFAGCFSDSETGRGGTGYSHDAQCVVYNGPDQEHLGKEVCFGSNETALSIADVTDKDNPVALSRASYPSVAYSHQGWLTDDHTYFFMNDELDELQGNVATTRTLIWDVSDLDDPLLLKEHFSENPSIDHNLYIKGNLMYQSNYMSGLRIFDISDIENPVEVGYFDTVPNVPDKAAFRGSWSNYPYFKSGTIIVTSIGEGLFVLKKREVDT